MVVTRVVVVVVVVAAAATVAARVVSVSAVVVLVAVFGGVSRVGCEELVCVSMLASVLLRENIVNRGPLVDTKKTIYCTRWRTFAPHKGWKKKIERW